MDKASVNHLSLRQKIHKLRQRLNRATGIALSYTAFLFICLMLMLALYLSSSSSIKDTFWQHQASALERGASTMDSALSSMQNYAQQLLTDTSLQRLSRMEDDLDADYVYIAWQAMQKLSIRSSGLLHLPIKSSFIYLPTSDHVISYSQSTPGERYYRAYRSFTPGLYEEWQSLLLSADNDGECYDVSRFTGNEGEVFYFINTDNGLAFPGPIIVWFELDIEPVAGLLLPSETDQGSVIMVNTEGRVQLHLGNKDVFSLPDAMAAGVTFVDGMADVDNMRLIRREGSNGLSYIIALPHSLMTNAMGLYSTLFMVVFLLALAGGAMMIILLVRRAMKPLHQLTSQLTQAEDDKAQLQREIDAQKPLLSVSYVRKLLSGHVASQEEFAYMMDYLGLSGEDRHYYVLYCIAHRQDAATDDALTEYDALTSLIDRHLTMRYPIYYYTTLDRSFVVLVTCDGEPQASLNELQQRVMLLHDELADSHNLWFYAGVGGCRTQASQLWESYEQARTAARYTARHHIFLPYEFIRKDTDSWYYPIEISAKLLHFITSGNREQVAEMLALIHKENLEDRSLSVSLLNLLLSDLKNTLFKARFQIAPPQTEEARSRLNQLDERLHEPPTFPSLEANALALCDFFIRTSTPSDPIPEVEIYLRENFTDPSLCLSKLGEQFNISESYLSHLFKERTGVNFSTYLERLRMEEAARQLRSGHRDLSTLYVYLGYSNPATFRRAFKKYHGITPSEMRDSKT